MFELVHPEGYEERTSELYRVRVSLNSGEERAVVILLQHAEVGSQNLVDAETELLETLTRTARIEPDVRQALREFLDLRGEVVTLQQQMTANRERERRIIEGHARLRENLAAVGRESTLGRRYLTQLSEDETELAELQVARESLNLQLADRRTAVAAFSQSIEVGTLE